MLKGLKELATQQSLTGLNMNLNTLLARVFGVLNASSLVLQAGVKGDLGMRELRLAAALVFSLLVFPSLVRAGNARRIQFLR
jgi:hypothetical protein